MLFAVWVPCVNSLISYSSSPSIIALYPTDWAAISRRTQIALQQFRLQIVTNGQEWIFLTIRMLFETLIRVRRLLRAFAIVTYPACINLWLERYNYSIDAFVLVLLFKKKMLGLHTPPWVEPRFAQMQSRSRLHTNDSNIF